MEKYFIYLIGMLLFLFLIKPDMNSKNSQSQLLQYGTITSSKNGMIIRSKAEKRIADWLESENISYLYEPKIRWMKPDFYLLEYDVYIEYWGLINLKNADGRKYRKQMLKKLNYYQRNKINLISIFPIEIKNNTFKKKIIDFIRKQKYKE